MATLVTNSPPSPPALPGPAADIRDIAPPIEIPSGFEWLWWTLGVILILAIAIVLWIMFRKRAKAVPAPPPLPAHVRAKMKLLEALGLISQPKPFVIAVSDAARAYLEERFNFRAPERTTEEFLLDLQKTDLLTRDQKESLSGFLERCDLVKFAKYEPQESELRELHTAAVRLVEETQTEEVSSTPTPEPARAIPAKLPEPTSSGKKPVSFQERLVGFAIAALLISIGVATWIWPDLHLISNESLQDGASGRGSRKILGLVRIIEFLWSRPLGMLAASLGLAVLWGVLTKKHKDSEQDQ